MAGDVVFACVSLWVRTCLLRVHTTCQMPIPVDRPTFEFFMMPPICLSRRSPPELRWHRYGQKSVLSLDRITGFGQPVYAALPRYALPEGGKPVYWSQFLFL